MEGKPCVNMKSTKGLDKHSDAWRGRAEVGGLKYGLLRLARIANCNWRLVFRFGFWIISLHVGNKYFNSNSHNLKTHQTKESVKLASFC